MTSVKADKVVNVLSPALKAQQKKAFEALKKKCLLVTLERATFANFVFDANFNDKICKEFNVQDPTVIQVRKCLIHPRHLQDMMNITNDAVMLLWNLTRPWDNNDFRLLPMEMYDDFQQTFQKLKDDFEEKFDVFKTNYKTYIKEAKATLGDAFDQGDYPTDKELDAIFELKIVTRELPDIEDVRLNLTDQELRDLEKVAGEKFREDSELIRAQMTSLLSGVGDFLRSGKSDRRELAKLLAPIGGLFDAIRNEDDSKSEEALMEFKDALESEFEDLDADDAMLTDGERVAKKFNEMSEEEMMMASDETFVEDGDDLDDW